MSISVKPVNVSKELHEMIKFVAAARGWKMEHYMTKVLTPIVQVDYDQILNVLRVDHAAMIAERK